MHCLFCNKGEELVNVASLDLSAKVYREAVLLGDSTVLKAFAVGDLVSIKAKYHRPVLLQYHRRAAGVEKTAPDQNIPQSQKHERILNEIADFIKEEEYCTDIDVVFKLSDLSRTFITSLDCSDEHDVYVHKIRFKDALLFKVPSLVKHRSGRDTLLTLSKVP